MSTKTIAIVGITGNQGASVANVFLNEPGWKIRGISRDPTKPSSKAWSDKGVEMVAGDLDHIESMKKAFKDANVIFGNTDFWQHMKSPATAERAQKEGRTPNEVAYDLELEQGKNMVDAVAANVDTLDRFVLSTLSDSKKWSKGKITFNLHFDSKSQVAKYVSEKYPELAKKTSFVQLGVFASNWKDGMPVPKKQENGTYKVSLPMGGDRKFPMVDPRADAGHFTKALVELPAGKNLVGAGSLLSWNDWCQIWGKINGVTCTFERTDRKYMDENMGSFGRELADMFQYIDEFGYDGSDPSVEYPWNLGVNVKRTTMEEYLKKQDWSSIL
ncbi:NAD(P)-binding protein [Lindgomyces ingoldianus]|uniref:NAD(P)-binding protein n=1 Tax=Lindgomyces ingoldianus TaxID=673940 RepID=A0ACB6RFX3_9PLEO|nr:NAD(P)-binding protein [Lindgomyces ingoldianus]KAF2477402.1 NAD(P)-binding protein [Lindgomyces ingoldianus]